MTTRAQHQDFRYRSLQGQDERQDNGQLARLEAADERAKYLGRHADPTVAGIAREIHELLTTSILAEEQDRQRHILRRHLDESRRAGR